ncbi:Gp37 family protein [Paraburkholderia sp. BR14263]|uniref:Gp37 family protein n=1 Tax=unclassified Paraburkholderia TaxID=2615204 RepID=UPI0034CE7157
MALVTTIEDALVAQLTAAFTVAGEARPWLKVESWPKRPEGYALSGAGDVLVIYKSGDYKPRATSSAFYDTGLEFEIVLRSKNLRGHQGAYDMLETAFRATCGKRIPEAAGITLAVRDGLSDYGEGVYTYVLVVKVPVVIVQDIEAPPGDWITDSDYDAPLARITFTRP